VVGALLSSLLLPSLTRQWQNHEKELEFRATLVEEMNTATADFVVALKQATFNFAREKPQVVNRALNIAWADFDRRQAVITGKLSSYFQDPGLGDTWKRHADALVDFLYFLRAEDQNFTNARREKIVNYIGEEGTLVRLEEALERMNSGTPSPEEEQAEQEQAEQYEALALFIEVEKRWYSKLDALVGTVLETNTVI